VNFKKNEKKYNYENSEVYKMLQEVESESGGGGDDHSAPMSPGRNAPSFQTNSSVPYSNVLNRQQQQAYQQPQQQQAYQQPQQQQAHQQQQQPQQQQQAYQPIRPQQQQQQPPAAQAPAAFQQLQQQQQPLISPRPQQQQQQQQAPSPQQIPIQPVSAPTTSAVPAAGQTNANICADCERLIV
jgi:hypothetical protein